MRSFPVKENPIGSAVSEILRYKQTDILLLFYKVKSYIKSLKILFPAAAVVLCSCQPLQSVYGILLLLRYFAGKLWRPERWVSLQNYSRQPCSSAAAGGSTNNIFYWLTDGPTDRQIDGKTDRQMLRQTDRLKDRQTVFLDLSLWMVLRYFYALPFSRFSEPLISIMYCLRDKTMDYKLIYISKYV